MSGGDETDFVVSFDGSFSRGFEGTEFIVSPLSSTKLIKLNLRVISLKGEKTCPQAGSSSDGNRARPNIGGGKALQRVLGLSDWKALSFGLV